MTWKVVRTDWVMSGWSCTTWVEGMRPGCGHSHICRCAQFGQWSSIFGCWLSIIQCLSRMESMTSHNQRIPSSSPPKPTPKLKYSHVIESTLWPHDPGKLSYDLSHVQSHDTSTPLKSRDIQARDPGKVSHDLPTKGLVINTITCQLTITWSYALPMCA